MKGTKEIEVTGDDLGCVGVEKMIADTVMVNYIVVVLKGISTNSILPFNFYFFSPRPLHSLHFLFLSHLMTISRTSSTGYIAGFLE